MAVISRGFHGRRGPGGDRLPPGQYLTEEFPVLSAGPTPHIPLDRWSFTLTTAAGEKHTWDWDALMSLPSETPQADIHCVTRWSKYGTRWRGVPVDAFLEGVDPDGTYVLVTSYGGYSTDMPLADVTGGRAWIVHEYDGAPLPPEHGGPARMLVPHLYFWKSAKWVNGMRLTRTDEPGFWEQLGYHAYGDPWREQRVQGD